MDEREHFDTVVKYARGYLPDKAITKFDKESMEAILMYGVSDYICKPANFPQGVLPPPLCALPNDQHRAALKEKREKLVGFNTEASSPPVYYLIAGEWYNMGKLLGKHGIGLLYWIRFLNAGIIFLTVWFSYLFSKEFFPDTKFMHIGLPLVVAFFPQDQFYAIGNDVLSPLCFTIALYLLLQWFLSDANKHQSSIVAGAFVAITFLTKFSNISIIGIVWVLCLWKILRSQGTGRFKESCFAAALVMISVILPVGLWCMRNKIIFGDFSGSMAKTVALGWTVKPLGMIGQHPLFTPKGMMLFLNDLTRSFWRGEFTWHLERLSLHAADLFYCLSSFIFILAAGTNIFFSQKTVSKNDRSVRTICFMALLFSVIFLMGVSITFDFGHCWYPSREYPYISSGRLILGAIIPFFVLYLNGISVIMKKMKLIISPVIVIGAIVFFMTWSEVTVMQPVFSNPYNWFNLKG